MPTGSCVCGDYGYEIPNSPTATIVCHCKPCQKFAGANGSTNIIVSKDQYKLLKGETTSWTRKGDSGGDVTMYFCSSCKTLMRVEASFMPDKYIVKPGTLDDVGVLNEVPVSQEIYTRNRPSCFDALQNAHQKKGATE